MCITALALGLGVAGMKLREEHSIPSCVDAFQIEMKFILLKTY